MGSATSLRGLLSLGLSVLIHVLLGIGWIRWEILGPQSDRKQETEFTVAEASTENKFLTNQLGPDPAGRPPKTMDRADLKRPTEKKLKEIGPENSTDRDQISLENSKKILRQEQLSASEKYQMELKRALQERKVYPASAKRLRQQGRVLVRFVLKEDGRLVKAEVIEPSPFQIFNEAAEELVRSIDGFKPFPPELKDLQMWTFQLPIEYVL